MAKKRTLNEIRQEKNYGYKAPILSDQGGEYIIPHKGADAIAAEQMAEIDLDEVKDEIVDKLTKHFHDIMFEMINEAMMDYRIFQSQTYLTEEGYELFEDEYFEFYHEHHGDILYQVMQNITN
jgi:hypothetical protein